MFARVSTVWGRWASRAACLLVFVLVPVPIVFAQDAAGWVGRWQVARRGPTLGPSLRRLEVAAVPGPGDAVVTVIRGEPDGPDSVWGSGRLDRDRRDPSAGRAAEWVDGGLVVRLTIRATAGGRVSAVLRLRDRARPWAVPERVGECLLEREIDPDGPPARPISDPEGPPARDRSGVFRVDLDSRNLRVIARPEGFIRAAQPAASPDGRAVAFAAFDATGRQPLIRVAPIDGADGTAFAVAAGTAPSWSRDSRRIAYVASGKADYATDWDRPGRNEERIECVTLGGEGAGQVEAMGQGLWPRWAPADDRLAFVARSASNWDIHIRSADGMGLTRLTDDPALDTFPAWEPGGKSLIFLSNRGNRWDLYRVSADGRGVPARITNHYAREHRADLSPDGTRVVFADAIGRPGGTLLMLDLASGVARPLLEPSAGDRDPSWSPDGKFVVFASRRPW